MFVVNMHYLLCFVLLHQCWLTIAESNRLDVTNIRLADGSGPFEGRVEIQVDGVWGTICDWSFSTNDAEVMCRTMGLLRTAQFNGGYYEQGIGPIFAQTFYCNGDEFSIRDCPYAPNTFCSHQRDIGLICTECGKISVQNGDVRSISADGTVLTISCNVGYEIKNNTSICLNGSWSEESFICSSIDISDIQLVNGLGISDGRVELLVNNSWIAVCRHQFHNDDAKVLCRMLGFPDVYEWYLSYKNGYGFGSTPIYLNDIKCNGVESHINNCTYEIVQTCSYRDVVAVSCKYIYNTTDIRLAGGTGPDNGRLEIMVNGTWGTVCSRYGSSFYVDVDVMETYCRMIGLNLTMYNQTTKYGESNGLILKGYSTCDGPKESINNCTTYPPRRKYCSHHYDAYLACTPCGLPNIRKGYLHSVNGTEFTALCYEDYSPKEFKLHCQRNGTWIQEDVCTYKYAYPLDIDDIRLANSDRPSEGRVELLVNGSWGTVCGNNFDNASAAVICQMIGLKLDAYYTAAKRYGKGSGRIYVENLKCDGSERHINNCSYNVENTCTHAEDVSVVCTGPPLNITDGRLSNGTGPYDGRVEIKVGNKWGTICDETFGIVDAEVFCRLLGLRATHVFTGGLYGEGNGPIFIDQLFCDDNDVDLSSCRYLFHNACSHEQDVSVVCTACGVPAIKNGKFFLVNDTQFTAQCNDDYIPQNVTLYCHSNGTWIQEDVCTYKYACGVPAIKNGKFFLVNDTQFTAQCNDDYIPQNVTLYCHSNGTWIQEDVCTYKYAYPLDIVDIKLANSDRPSEGRVELLVDGSWGTVCNNNFNSSSAAVICRMVGLVLDTYYTGINRYGRGSGRIYVDNLKCNGSENHINKCHYNVENSCSHRQDVSVVCTGPPLNITDGRLVNGTGPYDGRAEIKVGDTWGTICDENFGIMDAEAFCRLLGLRAARIFTGGLYGEGSGPIFIDQLFCSNHDIDLRSCKYLFLNECSHEQDVAIVCNECGQPDIYYWDAGYFSYNGTTLYADCSYYKTYVGKLELTCDNMTNNWMKGGKCEEYRFPLHVTDIRLSNGPSETNGRVEIKSAGVWGTICDDGFGKTEADAVCHMIGYPPAQSYFHGAYYGEGSGPIFVDDLSCAKNATHINNCTYKTYDNCFHSNDISVNCTDCGTPKPDNGSINSSATIYGSGTVVKVICDQNFMLVGEQVISCQIAGTWTDRPRCELIKCGDPTPKHGLRNTSETVVGTVVYVSCIEGYNMSGDAILTCQSDKSWTDSPSCEIMDCGELSIDRGYVALPNNRTTYGETARINCWPGYILYGNHTVSCLSDGNWEVLPTCEIVDCGDPVPYKASANSTETTFNSVVEITCDPGQNITGNFTIICKEDGTWTDNPTCDVNDCGILSIPHGNVNDSLGTSVDSVVTITCDRGFDLKGNSLARCFLSDAGAAWNYSATCERQVCGDPILEHGSISGGDERYEYGNYAEIVCDKGYNLVGDNVIVCDDTGRWSDTPRCEIVVCEDLTDPQNGYVDTSQGSTYNAKSFYSCKEGYLLVGERMSVCEESGEWDNIPPTCVAKSEVGGPCISEKYCLMEYSKCVNFVCTCVTGIFDSRTKKCDTMPLMPFGATVGDVEVTKSNKCGPKLSFKPGFPLFGEMHFDLFVCVFGFLSIDGLHTNPTPPDRRNNLRTSYQNRAIIAPFYAQIDPQTSGPVWYRTYDILNSPEKFKDNEETISFIEHVVVKFERLDSFEASFILVATWHDTKTNAIGFDSTKTSTFQVVLVSDGKSTYTFFIYGNGMMQWLNNLSENPIVWTGFSIYSVITTNAYSFSNVALQLDSKILVSTSENDVAGLFYRSLNKPGQRVENPAVDCIRWYNHNFKEKKRLDDIARLMPECPCDIRLARFDPFFWHINQNLRRGVKYSCVDMLHVGNFASYGKSCCYDLKTWLWVYERPLAGGFQLYNSRHHPEEHIINDVIPKTSCCAKSNHCNLFYKLRPIGSCYRRSPYNFGSFWGDPHFVSLDGMNFTFNGLGEYSLLKTNTDNCTFDLQARTERALKENGELSAATVFSAFAARDSSGSTVHVERNIKKDGMNLYGNKIDLTRQFNSHSDFGNPVIWTSEEGNITISKRNESVNVHFPSCGISLTVSIKVEMLSLTTFVPKALRNKTKGLLGNYDDDPYNDFNLPNGTILNANMTEKEIFRYGKTWSIHPSDSAFVYAVGKSHEDYHNNSYQPRFFDDIDEDLRVKAVSICNGVQNRECIFDYVFTEKEEVANETLKFKQHTEEKRVEIDEAIPFLIGCSTVLAVKGNTVSCKFNASDNVYFVSNNADAKIDGASSTITYVQTTDEPVDIRISSRNENGRSSPTFVLGVILCTNCSGHGICKNVTRKDSRENEYFRYAACECDPQYEGIDCENEFDGCAANPCSWNRTCEKLSAEEQKAQNMAYKCGPCPEGFITDDEDECIDVDECSNDKGGCEQNCINFDGSYRCSCYEGYRTNVLDIKQCTDINECDEAIHNCDQLCNNTEGSFECQCYNGYEYNATLMACHLTSGEICTDEQWNQCANVHECTTENGQPFCFCMEGYEIKDNGSACIDIDECSRGVCSQGCVNTIGSFQCSCLKGYRLENVATCTECDVLHWGNNCEQICTCNGQGADHCDPVKGCVCSAGWTGTSCNDDINECKTVQQPCDDKRKECLNTLGSYSCECKKGFHETEEGNCEDIDECGLGTFNCEQRCANNVGSYSCFCHLGYIINDDRRTCSKVSDPCWTLRNINCSHFCLLEDGIAECKCQDGYILESDEETCADINECTDSNRNRCDEDATCLNTAGSYQCKCSTGKQLENDGRTCSECDRFHYGENCSQKCSCLNGICDKKIGCVCDSGWAGNQCDVDIDECSTGQVICSSEKSVCVNILGSAFCSCETGYELVSGICRDINECAGDVCDQTCINTDGSFYCTCEDGFIMEDKCRDIDECSGFHDCSQICHNTVGSYRCLCEDGFQLNLDNRQTCVAENECSEAENNICTENSYCYVSKGKAICKCFKGYQNVNERCEDIDECLSNPCSQECSNTEGLFECSCLEGYSLMSDGVTCQECSSWMYGQNCSSNCLCDQHKAKECSHVTGICTCKQGWTGTHCDEDVNECENESVCPDNSLCENRNGSFVCTCDTGFFKTGKGNCNECDKRHFGNNCFNECTCNFENTDDCHHETGLCICYQGWAGDNCTEDINECDDIPDICEGKPNSTCINDIGSYFCECNEGYQDINGICEVCEKWQYGNKCEEECSCVRENTETCNHVTGDCICKIGWKDVSCSLDIDECAENASVCFFKPNSTCQNTNGSYSCDCDDYFHEQGDRCTDCNLWTFGESCDLNCTCDTSNSQYCDPRDGSCTCNPGWNGTNCAQDIDECEVNDVCPVNSSCVNTLGGFYCECYIGHYMNDDEKCQECSNSTYGSNCTHKCNCNGTNSENENQSCDRVTGECICKSNWGGNTCNEDINECHQNKTLCNDEGNKTCLNTDGSFECDCLRGFIKRSDGDCVEDSGQAIQRPVGGLIINITVTFHLNLPNDTNLDASKTYEKMRNICEESFLTFIGRFVSDTVQVIVIDIRSGSVEVDYTIAYGTIDSTVASKLTEAIFTLQNSSFVIFDNANVNASSDTYIDAEPCAFFEELIGGCNVGLVCKLEGVAPTCKEEEEETNVNLPLIIGLSAGILILFIIIAVLFVMARKIFTRQSINPGPGRGTFQQHRHHRENGERFQRDGFEFEEHNSWIFRTRMYPTKGKVLTVSEASDKTPPHGDKDEMFS